MEVLIVSKTHMTNAACVGGLVLADNRYIRLLNPGNYNQPTDTDFEIGDIWELQFINRSPVHPPHVEDVIITSKKFLHSVGNMPTVLEQQNIIDWRGHINNVFGGLLHWTHSGTGYIPEAGPMPDKSVGFWVPEKDLIRVVFENNKTRFRYPNGAVYRNISYVGFQDTNDTIPAGTIIRLSLSRIFPPEGSSIQAPRGYYLQLSGWYSGDEDAGQNDLNEPLDDLPF